MVPLEENTALSRDAAVATEVPRVVLLDGPSVHQDLAGCGCIQALQQVDGGGLAASRFAHDCNFLSRLRTETESIQQHLLPLFPCQCAYEMWNFSSGYGDMSACGDVTSLTCGVGEHHVLELDVAFETLWLHAHHATNIVHHGSQTSAYRVLFTPRSPHGLPRYHTH